MRTWIVVLAAAFLLQLSPAGVRAQGSGPDFVGSDTSLEIGFHLGKLLPNLVPGATEILSLGGVRGGFRIGPMV
jgi:hypothetical protein